MSPYLFILVMETLSQIITYNTQMINGFNYHWKCDKLAISHLCFANDLLLLFHGYMQSAQIMQASLNQFHVFTGLLTNSNKSCVFLAGVDDEVADSIC